MGTLAEMPPIFPGQLESYGMAGSWTIPSTARKDKPPNGLELSRLAGEGRAAWAEASCTGPVPSAQDQIQAEHTPAGRPVSISDRRQRDLAGQVGSIELL